MMELNDGQNLYQIIALGLSLLTLWVGYKAQAKAKGAAHGVLSMLIVAAISLGATQVFQLTNLGELVGIVNFSDLFSIIALGALLVGAMQYSNSK